MSGEGNGGIAVLDPWVAIASPPPAYLNQGEEDTTHEDEPES
jgi:hypothetical protein